MTQMDTDLRAMQKAECRMQNSTTDNGPLTTDPSDGETPGAGWIQTFTGKRFWPLSPRAEDVDIRDIAHALAMKCRFNGHTREFYSVAQHSVLVAHLVAETSPQFALDGLLHDAAEAYLPDVASPIKDSVLLGRDLRTGAMYDLFWIVEHDLLTVIHHALGLGRPNYSLVKDADLTLLATEARDLMHQPPPAVWKEMPEPLAGRVWEWNWDMSEDMFLFTYRRLRNGEALSPLAYLLRASPMQIDVGHR